MTTKDYENNDKGNKWINHPDNSNNISILAIRMFKLVN